MPRFGASTAMTTAALALPDHGHAAAWLAQGVAWINESLAAVVRDPGWYAEGAHSDDYRRRAMRTVGSRRPFQSQ